MVVFHIELIFFTHIFKPKAERATRQIKLHYLCRLCPREQRPVFSGAALIFVLGEIVLFQPNPYDNNKLFYVAYLFACFLVADFIMLLVERLKTKPLRAAFLALVVVIGCSAAVFTLGR